MNTFNDMYLFYGTSLAKDAQGNPALGQGVTIRYSYPTAVGQISYAAPSQLAGFVALTPEQTLAAEMARARWSDVANITWVATPNAQTTGIISIATAAMGAEGSAPLPTRTTTANPEQLHVAISNTHSKMLSRPTLPVGSGGFHALLHEIGHALGLDHTGGSAELSPGSMAVSLPTNENYALFSVMSYPLVLGNAPAKYPSLAAYPITPMLYDIAAIQRLYGVNTNYHAGSTPYVFTDTSHPFSADTPTEFDAPESVTMTLWDGDGTIQATGVADVLDARGLTTVTRINLMPGEFSAIGTKSLSIYNVGIAFGTIIENAIGGSANDAITGNDVNNILEGNGGKDSLNGGAGTDELYGERKGTAALNGAAGDDTLDGGTAIGQTWDDGVQDTLVGGVGTDRYIVHQSATNGKGVADKIIDSGSNLVIVHDAKNMPSYSLNNRMLFKKTPGQSVWATADSGTPGSTPTLQLSINSPATIVDDQRNATVILGNTAGDFQSGDFGITLRDAPTAVNLNAIAYTAANDTQTGTASNDRMQGLAGRDRLSGGDGADWLEGGADGTYPIGTTPYVGGDILFGGLGNDVLVGNSSSNLGTAAETLNDIAARIAQTIASTSTTLGDLLSGGDGDDTLIAGDGINFLSGGSGGDLLVGGIGDDYLFGGYDVTFANFNWAPTITSSSITFKPNVDGDDRPDDIGDAIYAGAGNDRAYGEAGDDYLDLGQGNDIATGGAGNDVLLGADGDDTILGDSSVASATDGMDFLDGGAGNDTLAGGGMDDYLLGGAGDDALAGESGNDVLIGGIGNDTLEGGAGRDTYYFNRGDGQDVIIDTAAGATLPDGSANPEASVIILGAGIDSATFVISKLAATADALIINLGNAATGIADTLTLGNLAVDVVAPQNRPLFAELRFASGRVMLWEDVLVQGFEINGTTADDSGATALLGTNNASSGDHINGLSGNDQIYAYAGNDVVDGGPGNDLLQGDTGNDTLLGGTGNDSIYGGEGNDVADGGDGADLIYGDAGADTLRGGTGDDLLYALNDSNTAYLVDDGNGNVLEGGDGQDVLYGAAGADTLRGDAGVDVLLGFEGNDRLEGGDGNDQLLGYIGSDTLIGGTGNDVLKGGARTFAAWFDPLVAGIANIDTYVFQRGDGVDTIDDPDDGWSLFGSFYSDGSIIELGAEISRSDLVFVRNVSNVGQERLRIDLGYGDAIVFSGTTTFGASTDFSQNRHVGEIRFADGTKMFNSEINSAGYTFNGTSNSEYLPGTNGANDRIYGFAGNDRLDGKDGDDVLDGGAGNDTLEGSAGADTAIFGRGDGQDLIPSSLYYYNYQYYNYNQNLDVVRFRQGVLPSDIVVGQIGNDLLLTIRDTGDSMRHVDELTGWTPASNDNGQAYKMLKEVRFDTGEVWSFATLLGKLRIITGTAGNDSLTANVSASSTVRGLAGNDTLTGNAQDNTLEGGDGNDTINGGSGNEWLDGGAGADSMAGGAGNDFYIRDNAGDVIIENPGAGTDLVQASVTTVLSDNVENLRLVGSTAINGIGNILGNRIEGNSADNVLDGGTGNDMLIGGTGSDTYYVDSTNDTVNENLAEGAWDRVYTAVNYTLANNIEGIFPINGTGATLTGNSGNNYLGGSDDGMPNVLRGMGGNDYYAVNAGDVVEEATGSDIDTVASWGDWMLSANVENLDLGGNAPVLIGTGNASANILNGHGLMDQLYGMGGNDTLNGFAGDDILDGGTGNDMLIGGTGSDTYYVDSTNDTVNENLAEGGWDRVYTSVNYILANNIEGIFPINGTGATLTGNSEINYLGGSDDGMPNVLRGMGGNDYYAVNAGDVVEEATGSDIDTVGSWGDWMLSANVENLDLGGNAPVLIGTGNASANILNGRDLVDQLNGMGGNDTLNGFAGDDILDGGAGIDSLAGGTGSDAYYVDSSGDTVNEAVDEGGWDRVYTAVNYTLANNIEGIFPLNGTGATLTGNSGNNYLGGSDDGMPNLLRGMGGNDYYAVNVGDVVEEAPGSDIDTVASWGDWMLSANVENLDLGGNAPVLIGTGNASANILNGHGLVDQLYGMGGNDTLNGFAGDDILDGGTGNDMLIGGNGSDTYYVDSASDTVNENLAEGGWDRVYTSVNYILANNIEGIFSLNGTGATLTGNSEINYLGGSDDGMPNVLRGMGGNDYYAVNAGDVVEEASGSDIDTVSSWGDWMLSANVENLDLGGNAPMLIGTGNASANILNGHGLVDQLYGMGGNDTLNGFAGDDILDGGTGNDTLVGGTGNDLYELGRGDGADTVQENDSTAGNLDTARFLSGVASNQVWFSKASNNLDLEASILGTTDKFLMQNWFQSDAYHVEQFKTTDGNKTLSTTQSAFTSLLQTMAGYTPGSGATTLADVIQSQTVRDTILAAWQ